MKETYPTPTRGKKPPAPSVTRIPIRAKGDNYIPNFSGTRADWEEAIFRHANHFTVFRLHRKTTFRPVERVSVVFSTFPEAIAEAGPDVNALVYAVTLSGDAFCVPRSAWEQYLSIWNGR